ncbi:hypothetical protein SSBR45G_09810 [Bradyrhizobium sp. SSBR45G]|uniref:hypothetical protein n=1 Tax=unclassified Bradyrhizobium TaxID=2631580 RepID=UPI002342A3D4|nr:MULTISPECIES: hypothetical protein [unclassified Bradyrhizobium]GLH76073.1 hypothetical protein SSBR45G_09810 [Bradyrhizobium sp. SSBR45G]GLH83443.1 hypothetical protein SSBR45R_09030 [Bradyrhizobium sp. SSBR45R]
MSKVDMSRLNFKKPGGPVSAVPPARSETQPSPAEPTEEDRSKDAFFAQVGELAEAMIAQHGSEFAIGTLVLAAKFVAEGRPLVSRGAEAGEAASAAKPV